MDDGRVTQSTVVYALLLMFEHEQRHSTGIWFDLDDPMLRAMPLLAALRLVEPSLANRRAFRFTHRGREKAKAVIAMTNRTTDEFQNTLREASESIRYMGRQPMEELVHEGPRALAVEKPRR